MAEYDNIAKIYSDIGTKSLVRQFSIDPSFLTVVGDVRGKSILDLACGDGHFCRLFHEAGASRVFGVDISKEMIKLAREKTDAGQNISYEVYDVTSLPLLGKFDLVVGTYLLHYAPTPDILFQMINNIKKNLKPGGRFIGINSNPDHPLRTEHKYGSTITADLPLEEGSELLVTLYHDNHPYCSFKNFHWLKETYNKQFEKAGFQTVEWTDCRLSTRAQEELDHHFWNDYKSTTAIIEARLGINT